MRAVGIRELKNKLSEYLRLVGAGEEILVTDHGRVVAEIRPPGRPPADALPPGVADLVRRGLARAGAPNDPGLYRVLPRLAPDGTAARLLDEDRGER
jgi:antitoxin (DNA-binding transcriptional repressor) of toxin-antitoxin stability system